MSTRIEYVCGLCQWRGTKLDEQAIRTPLRVEVTAAGWRAVFDMKEPPIAPGYVCYKCGASVQPA